jgi:nucleotide-binding universal stress UspA family protein
MKVLIGYDRSIHAEAAIADLDRAGLPMDTEARVLAVVERPFDSAAEQTAEDVCNRLQRTFRSWSLQSETATGYPSQTILDRAREWSADLIVLGTHGRSALRRLVLGSVSATVSRDAPCSVRIARPPATLRDGPPRLLIGYDGSPESIDVVNEVSRRSWPHGTEVRVVTVLPASPAAAEELSWLQDVAASSVVLDGDPKAVLVEEGRKWHADAIFIGARGLGRLERLLLGRVSTAVLTNAPCTVEIVRRQ